MGAQQHFHYDETEGRPTCCGYVKKGITFAIEKFHSILNRAFFNLGKYVALYRGYFIIIPLFLTAIASTGLQNIKYEDDPEYLFAPTTGAARGERAVFENNFVLNYSKLFDPTRVTRSGRFARFIVSAKDKGTIFRKPFWDDIMELDGLVKGITIVHGKKTYGFEDLCAIRDGACFKNDVLGVSSVISEVENGTLQLQYPINLEPFLLPHFFGGVETDENGEVVLSSKAVLLYYWIKADDEDQDLRGQIWEKTLLDTFAKKEFDVIDPARFTSRTLEDELESNTKSVEPFIPVTLALMTGFSILVCLMGDWVRAKPYIGVIGVVISCFSSFTAFGFLIYIGIPFIGINMAAPFLMLGIGIDDTFVLLAAWRRTRPQDSVAQRLAETYADAAVSITITSLTDMVSFYIGIITPFPSVQIFCIYTGTAVLVTYVWHITLFGACLAVAGHAERKQRHSILCIKVKPVSEAELDGCCYGLFCSGGISEKDPWDPRDNKQHVIMVFFRDTIGKMLNIPAMKTFVICVFLLYLAGGIYGCLRVKEGLEKRRLSRYDSYSAAYYDMEDKYFRVFPYSVQVALTGDITYSDPQTKADILNLMKTFENLTYIEGMYTQSVMRNWYLFLEENAEWLDFNITDEKSFISHLREVYISDPNDVLNLDIKYNEDFTKILATRFIIQTYKLKDSNADKDMMEGLREVARNSKFEVAIFNPFFIFFDQFVLVRYLTLQAVSLAAIIMMIVCLIFIPNPWCSMWVAFSIVSIEIGVVGYMTMWDVNLDSISMINLIMCIGFSVDFSAHISYAYLTAKVETPNERVRECLFGLGLPILQGGVSTILGVVALLLAPSYIFLTFFKIVFLVIFFGIMHGIFLLPVLLSLLGPGSFAKSKGELYDKSKFVQKGDLQTKAAYANYSHEKQVGDVTKKRKPSPTVPEMMSTPASKHPSDKYSESTERDMGIGTSGEEESSEGSLRDSTEEVAESREGGCFTLVELKGTGKRGPRLGAPVPIKEMYSNKGFISDGEEERDRRRHQQRHKQLPRRNSNFTPSYINQSALQRNYSEHYRNDYIDEPRRKRPYYRDT